MWVELALLSAFDSDAIRRLCGEGRSLTLHSPIPARTGMDALVAPTVQLRGLSR